MRKKFLLILSILFLAVVSVFATTPKVNAASWGNLGAYTMPAKMRGTWVSHDSKSIYSKIRITKHTITLKRRHHAHKTDGKWNLRRQSHKWMEKTSMKRRIKSFHYAQKHRYMAVRKEDGVYVFNFGWGVPCNDADFNLRSKSNSKIHFENVIRMSNFYRVK